MLYFLPHCVCRAWSQDSGGLALSMIYPATFSPACHLAAASSFLLQDMQMCAKLQDICSSVLFRVSFP